MSDELRNSGGFLTLLIGVVWRWVSKEPAPFPRNVLPTPARLLLVSLAYLFARDWNHFLEIQERLLFNVTEIVNRAGSGIAIPPQVMSVAAAQQSPPPAGSTPAL